MSDTATILTSSTNELFEDSDLNKLLQDYRVISNEVYDTYEEYETHLEEEFAKTTLVRKFFTGLSDHDCEHLMNVTDSVASVAAFVNLHGIMNIDVLEMVRSFFISV